MSLAAYASETNDHPENNKYKKINEKSLFVSTHRNGSKLEKSVSNV